MKIVYENMADDASIINNFKTNKEISKLAEKEVKNRVKCECGHSINIVNRYDRFICSWCGKMVFKNKKDKFKYELKNRLRKVKI